jgi:hypothetical protein
MRQIPSRDKVIRAARRDAAAFYREFRGMAGPEGTDWLLKAWADTRCDLELTPSHRIQLWPEYLKTFSEETTRLASSSGQ